MRDQALRRLTRPARPVAPFAVAILVLFVWWVVAHNSGSGWVQALGDIAFGIVIVALFGPALALTRVKTVLTESPTDATAGLSVVIRVISSRRVKVRPVQPEGPETFIGPRHQGVDREITLLPAVRGLHSTVTLDVSTAAPFGIQWWSCRVVLSLNSPLYVAPRMGAAVRLPNWMDDRPGCSGPPRQAETGDARGVREYRPGDLRRRVHWAASAHAGLLMVREMEESAKQPVTLRLSLPDDAEAAERVAEQALATAVKLLDRGVQVVLATTETSGVVVAPIQDRRQAGRRLALAVGGEGPPGVELLL